MFSKIKSLYIFSFLELVHFIFYRLYNLGLHPNDMIPISTFRLCIILATYNSFDNFGKSIFAAHFCFFTESMFYLNFESDFVEPN